MSVGEPDYNTNKTNVKFFLCLAYTSRTAEYRLYNPVMTSHRRRIKSPPYPQIGIKVGTFCLPLKAVLNTVQRFDFFLKMSSAIGIQIKSRNYNVSSRYARSTITRDKRRSEDAHLKVTGAAPE